MKNFKRTILALALVVAMSLMGTACGGTEDGNLKGVDVENGILYVGNTAATEGALAAIGGPFNVGLQAAFYKYNNEGGYTGKLADGTASAGLKVALKHYDDKSVAADSKTLTEKLIHEDEVFAIVGNFGTDSIAANIPVIKEAKVPMVYAAAGSDMLYNANATGADRYIFPVQPVYAKEGAMLLLRAITPDSDNGLGYFGTVNGGLAGTKIGLVCDTTEASRTLTNGVEAEANTQGVNLNKYVVSNGNYGTIATSLKNAECDVVIVTLLGDAFVDAMVAFASAEYTTKVITTYSNSATVLNTEDGSAFKAASYATIFNYVKIYTQGWVDIIDYTYLYQADTPLYNTYMAFNAITPLPTVVNGAVVGFNAEYWSVAEDIYDYYMSVDSSDFAYATAFAYSYNSYALAGYIAGDLFCKGLKALENSGATLTRANYVNAMEIEEFDLVLSDAVSYMNGSRTGVEELSLLSVYASGGAATSAQMYGLKGVDFYRGLLSANNG